MAETKDELPVVAWLYHDGPTKAEIPDPMMGSVVVSTTRHPYYRNETPLTSHAAAQSRINALLEEVEDLRKDAERYRWLREQHWDKSTMCVVTRPKSCVKLGSICPSGELLDFDIDASLSSGRSGSGDGGMG